MLLLKTFPCNMGLSMLNSLIWIRLWIELGIHECILITCVLDIFICVSVCVCEVNIYSVFLLVMSIILLYWITLWLLSLFCTFYICYSIVLYTSCMPNICLKKACIKYNINMVCNVKPVSKWGHFEIPLITLFSHCFSTCIAH